MPFYAIQILITRKLPFYSSNKKDSLPGFQLLRNTSSEQSGSVPRCHLCPTCRLRLFIIWHALPLLSRFGHLSLSLHSVLQVNQVVLWWRPVVSVAGGSCWCKTNNKIQKRLIYSILVFFEIFLIYVNFSVRELLLIFLLVNMIRKHSVYLGNLFHVVLLGLADIVVLSLTISLICWRSRWRKQAKCSRIGLGICGLLFWISSISIYLMPLEQLKGKLRPEYIKIFILSS